MCGYATNPRKTMAMAADLIEASHDALLQGDVEGSFENGRQVIIETAAQTQPLEYSVEWEYWDRSRSVALTLYRNHFHEHRDAYDALRGAEKELRK